MKKYQPRLKILFQKYLYWTSMKNFIRRISYCNIRAITFIAIIQDEEIQRTRNFASRYSATKSGVNDISAGAVESEKRTSSTVVCRSPRTVHYCSVYTVQSTGRQCRSDRLNTNPPLLVLGRDHRGTGRGRGRKSDRSVVVKDYCIDRLQSR